MVAGLEAIRSLDPSALHTTVAPSTSRCTPLKVSCVRSPLTVTIDTPATEVPVMTVVTIPPLGV